MTNELKMDLQLFADDATDAGDKGEDNKDKQDDSQEFYSKAQVEEMLQKEADRRVTAARKKFEQEMQTKLESERKQAEKLAKLSEEEKAKHTIEQQRIELDRREKELIQKEIKLETVKILSEKGLPVDLIDMLVAADAEKTLQNIDNFESAFRKSVEEAVNKRLGTASGTPGSGSAGQIVTKEQFRQLDYRGRIELMNKSPELYNQLAKELD